MLVILDYYLFVIFNIEIFDRIFVKEKMFNYLEFFFKIMVFLILNYFLNICIIFDIENDVK